MYNVYHDWWLEFDTINVSNKIIIWIERCKTLTAKLHLIKEFSYNKILSFE